MNKFYGSSLLRRKIAITSLAVLVASNALAFESEEYNFGQNQGLSFGAQSGPGLSDGSDGAYEYAEKNAAVLTKSNIEMNKNYYVTSDAVNVRTTYSLTAKNVIGKLGFNDIVQVLDSVDNTLPLVRIRIIQSKTLKISNDQTIYISKDFLSEKSAQLKGTKYFVIQNVATEKTRVYERCTESTDCAHKMVFETDMIVGRPEDAPKNFPTGYRTWLGHSKIKEWVKFYQDGGKNYPRWYTPGQDIRTIPEPISNSGKLSGSKKWTMEKPNGDDTVYGAFGWYAAKLHPESADGGVGSQWIHGTIGWGKDGDLPIQVARSGFINFFGNPGSKGCTRLENRAVAYMRELLPVGTDVYRIYAREATRETEVFSKGGLFSKAELKTPLARYAQDLTSPTTWNYILLTNGAAESNGLTADASVIQAKGISVVNGQNLIEQGSYKVDKYPTVVPLNYTKSSYDGGGDRYEIQDQYGDNPNVFKGYFVIDEGRFVDYAHPSPSATGEKIRISGLPEFRTTVPDYLKTSGPINIPKPTWRPKQQTIPGAGMGGPR